MIESKHQFLIGLLAVLQNVGLLFLLKNRIMTVAVLLAKSLSHLLGAAFFHDLTGYAKALVMVLTAVSVLVLVVMWFLAPWSVFILPPNFYSISLGILIFLPPFYIVTPEFKTSNSSAEYNNLQKILTYLVLWDPRTGFGISKNYPSPKYVPDFKPIFLISMARQGSTAVSEYVCKHFDVAYLSYRMNPFFCTPELSKNQGEGKAMPRLHLDDIEVSNSSPDAFDEPMLQLLETKERSRFSDLYEKFLARLGAQSGKKFGFFKNNNNWKRLEELNKIAHSQFVCLLRDPRDTINSLVRNHIEFIRLAEQDSFFRDYLQMVQHIEFGPLYETPINGDPDLSLIADVFLDDWIVFMETVLAFKKANGDRIFFISSETWPSELSGVMKKLGFPAAMEGEETIPKRQNKKRNKFPENNHINLNPKKFRLAQSLYEKGLNYVDV